MLERWARIEYTQYEISNKGRVKSLGRFVPSKNGSRRFVKEKILNPSKTKNGYLSVSLYRDKKRIEKSVHRLVAEYFLENNCPDNKIEVNHKDGNKSNNTLHNLEWCSSSENNFHKTRVLKKNIGSLHGRAKLIEEEVIKIRTSDKSSKELSYMFNISKDMINRIRTRKNWTHI